MVYWDELKIGNLVGFNYMNGFKKYRKFKKIWKKVGVGMPGFARSLG